MDRFSVVIAGGGVAAMEGLLRLRRLAGEEVDITVLAPNDDFAFRALSVREPFAFGRAERHSLQTLAHDAGAEWIQDTLGWVDVHERLVHTGAGQAVDYDALLIAVGGHMSPAYEHVKTFRDGEADELFHGVVQDVEDGYSKSVAFLIPEGPAYMLPLYELAMMTAARAQDAGWDDVGLVLVTPEARPLARFGGVVAAEVEQQLARAGVAIYTSSRGRVPEAGTLVVEPGGTVLHPDRMIAMPRVTGPSIRGLAGATPEGFIHTDARAVARGGAGRVFAAGDATDFPIKHGGLSAQQADAAASSIARLAGVDTPDAPFNPVLQGKLLTGGDPLYLSARPSGNATFASVISTDPTWSSDAKVAAEELTTYLEEKAAATA
jgi:sulfide:quinone oxidoreductase